MSVHSGTAIDFTIPDDLRELIGEVRQFVEQEVLPAEGQVEDPGDPNLNWAVIEELRERARELGIFTPHMPESWGGRGVGVLGMALISEICGSSNFAALALNAMAPDEGNMHTLLRAATPEQQESWLRPLAEGRIRSCFAMTEPDVASSDPLNLSTTAVRDGDHWLLNGRKWFITGASGASVAIVVARTGEPELRHRAYSLFLVPTDTPGWKVLRDVKVLGPHTIGGHPEVELTDVRIPADHILGGEGEGFAISQERLAGGRLAHAMRWLGTAQRALDMMSAWLHERSAFGGPLAEKQALQTMLADSAMDIYSSRLMVLHTAWKVESGLPHRQEVSMLKTFVAEAYGRVLDRAVQIFGSHGIAADKPIGQWYADARAARIYDGTSEVHRMVIARNLLKLAGSGESTRTATGGLI